MNSKHLIIPALAILILSGCERIFGSKDREPLPTEHQVYRQYRDALEVILVRGNPSEEERQQAVGAFRGLVNTDRSEDAWYPRSEIKNYQDARLFAKRRIEEDILSELRAARDLELWQVLLGTIEAYWVLQANELLYSELYKVARTMADMPKLTNKGYKIDEADGREVILFEVDDPKTGTKMTLSVVEGQVFYNNRFRLEEIIGNFSAYKIRYLDVEDHTFNLNSTKRGTPNLSNTL